MHLEYSETEGVISAELVADDAVIAGAQDALDLIANAGYGGASHLIVQVRHLVPAFFDLRSGLAGEILQKFANYRMALLIVGDVVTADSDSLRAFIAECNRGDQVAFVPDRAAALARITR